MSNSNEGQRASQPATGKPESNRKATLIRQGVLIGILLIVGGLLAYDYLYARPAAERAYEKADEFKKSQALRDEVIEEFGEPSQTFKKEGGVTIDQYNFRSGAIFRSYKVYVVYAASGLVDYSTMGKEPKAMSLDPESSEAADSEDSPSEDNNPAGNPVNAGSGGDPATFVAMIMQNDADGDGKLSGDEIPQRMRDDLDRVDTNADGAIDRDELTAMAETLRGRGNGDGGDRPQRPSRPETED